MEDKQNKLNETYQSKQRNNNKGKNIDLFDGMARSNGSRYVDYQSQRGVSTNEKIHKERQWEIESNYLRRMSEGRANKSLDKSTNITFNTPLFT